jgi:alpha-1,6-mannosyltransferase
MPAPRSGRASAVALTSLALILGVLLWLFAHTDRSLGMRGRQIGLFFAAFGVFLIAVVIVWRYRAPSPARLVWLIVGAGIAMRLSVAPLQPVTTSDIYRYLWEGRVVRSGANPYRYAPDSPRLERLRDDVWRMVQHKRVSAAYPPVAQCVFALSDAMPTDRLITLKLVLALFDIGTVLLLPGLLARVGRPAAWVLVYAWHPLVVGEVVARGHLDTIGIFFLVTALRLMPLQSASTGLAAGASVAASALAKGYAVVTVPFFLLASGKRWTVFVAGMVAVTAISCAPFVGAGLGLFRGVSLYAEGWKGNASVFPLVDWGLSRVTDDHDQMARATCAAVLVAFVVWLVRRMCRRQGGLLLWEACFLSLAAFFVLSPVVYPWYLAWTVPFLCLRPGLGWLLLTGTIFGFYAHDFAGHHVEISWVTALEYGVPAMAAVLSAGAGVRRARANGEGQAVSVCHPERSEGSRLSGGVG